MSLYNHLDDHNNCSLDRAVFKFDGARIVCSARGSDFTEFRTQFSDDDRAFGYLRWAPKRLSDGHPTRFPNATYVGSIIYSNRISGALPALFPKCTSGRLPTLFPNRSQMAYNAIPKLTSGMLLTLFPNKHQVDSQLNAIQKRTSVGLTTLFPNALQVSLHIPTLFPNAP